MQPRYLPAFTAASLAIDVAILDLRTGLPAPGADHVLVDACGGPLPAVQMGHLEWRRRMMRHELSVGLLKPTEDLHNVGGLMAASLRLLDEALAPHGLRLLAAGTHPWASSPVSIRDDDRAAAILRDLVDLSAPGWTDNRAARLIFPFFDDEDFRPLQAAVRLLAPLVPAIAAASPWSATDDPPTRSTRIAAARRRATEIPAWTGAWLPEATIGVHALRDAVSEPIRRSLTSLDPDGRLDVDAVNGRAAVVRFSDRTLTLSAADVQECAAHDAAIAALVSATAQRLAEGAPDFVNQSADVSDRLLAALLDRVLADGLDASLGEATAFGSAAGGTVRDFWRTALAEAELARDQAAAIDFLLREGALADRLRRVVGVRPERSARQRLTFELADCARENRPWIG